MPPAWQKFYEQIQGNSRLATVADQTFTDANQHSSLSMRRYFPCQTTLPDGAAAFEELLTHTTDLRSLVTAAVESNSAFRSKYLISSADDDTNAIAIHNLEPEDQSTPDIMAIDMASYEHIVPAEAPQHDADADSDFAAHIASLTNEDPDDLRLTLDGARLLPYLLSTVP